MNKFITIYVILFTINLINDDAFASIVDAPPEMNFPVIDKSICKLEKCIKWCCDKDQYYDYYRRRCSYLNSNTVQNLVIQIYENSTKKDLIKDYNSIFMNKPCSTIYPPTEQWYLINENLSVYFPQYNDSLSINDYCLSLKLDNITNHFEVILYACSYKSQVLLRDYLYASALIISNVFTLMVIIVYLIIPELRNLHGKSLICQLLCSVVTHSNITYILLKGPANMSGSECTIIGFTCYYFYLSSFFWLNVISFDLWWHCNGKKIQSSCSDKRKFIFYSIYAWSCGLLFVAIAFVVQRVDCIPSEYKIDIGENAAHCFLNLKDGWSALYYFYGINMILIGLNILMFISTSMRINQVKCEMTKILEKKESQMSLRLEKDKFNLFLRLFLIMGVSYSIDIIQYFVGHKYEKYFIITDVWIIFQGFFIFLFFVVKKRIKLLIMKRLRIKSEDRNYCSRSSKTHSTHLTVTNVNQVNDQALITKTRL